MFWTIGPFGHFLVEQIYSDMFIVLQRIPGTQEEDQRKEMPLEFHNPGNRILEDVPPCNIKTDQDDKKDIEPGYDLAYIFIDPVY